MVENKVGEGGRNNALTQVGIYYNKSDPDNWQEKMLEWNYRYMEEPLPGDEVRQIGRNVSKSKYEYLCKLEPMCALCNKDLCLTKKWGVGPQHGIDYQDYDIDRIIKIMSDPPIYYVVINGDQVKMNSEMLLSPSKFRRRR